MNYNSKSKNIFINMLLIIALITSMVGGAFLILPDAYRHAQASEVINGKPTDVKFVSTVDNELTATDFNTTNGFTYASGDKFNYVNVKNIIYYVNSGRLYIDPENKMEAVDVDPADIDLSDPYDDRYVIEHDGLRYYLNSSVLYSDLACTQTAPVNYATDSNYVYIYESSPVNTINETINKYVSIDGSSKWYIYDNKLYNDKPFVYVTGEELTSISGVKQNNAYTSGFVFLGQQNCEVLYQISTDYIEADGKKLNRVSSVAENGTTYYVNVESFDRNIYTYDAANTRFNRVSSANISFSPTAIIERNEKNYLVATFAYGNVNNINAQFYLAPDNDIANGKIYYIINKSICTQNPSAATITKDNTISLSNSNDVYSLTGSYRTFTIDKNVIKFKTIGTDNYYPVDIFGTTCYVKDGSSDIYQLSRTAAGVLSAKSETELRAQTPSSTALPSNCTNAEVSFSNNLINVKVTYKALYSILYGNLYEINPLYFSNRSNFISHNTTYYYKNDDTLYLKHNENTTVQDFNYTVNLTNVEHGGVYHIIEVLEFKYTVIDGKTFYVNNNGELYSNIVVGGDKLIEFKDEYKVVNAASAYKVNTYENLITLFNLTNSENIDISDTFDGYFYGSVQINDRKYYIDKTTFELKYLHKSPAVNYDATNIASNTIIIGIKANGDPNPYYLTKIDSIYKVNGLVDGRECFYYHSTENTQNNGLYFILDFHDLNFDYALSISSGAPQEITVKGTTYSGFSQPVSNFYSIEIGPSGNTIPYYYYYNRTMPHLNGLYLYPVAKGNSNNYITNQNASSLFIDSSVTITNNDVFNDGSGDYLLIDNNNDDNPDIAYFEFNSFEYTKPDQTFDPTNGTHNGYVDVTDTFNYGGINYSYRVQTALDMKGTLLINEVDPSFIFMDYSYDKDKSIVTVNKKFDNESKTFKGTTAISNSETLRYVHNMTDSRYEVIGRDGNSLKLYRSVNIDANHSYNYANEIESCNFIASNIHIDYQPTTTLYDILSETGKSYNPSHNESDNIEDGGFAFLPNFTVKHAFLDNSTPSNVSSYYIGFNEARTVTAGVTPTISSGVHQLQVQAYLNNDYVTKYNTISSSYYTDAAGTVYGILLDINNIVEESVRYENLADTTINVNHYWYQYIDLTTVHALVRYKTDESQFRREKIEDASGLYTFIFQYTYINNGTSTQYMFKYSVYITENSHYIDYPTFNTQVTSQNGNQGTLSSSDFETIVEEKSKNDGSDAISYGNYSYNNSSYDIPIYVYDASRYNVSYTYKYNVSQNTYTTEFILVNAGLAGEYGILSIYKDGTLSDTYQLDIFTKLINGRPHGIVKYIKNGNYYGSLCITPSGHYRLSIENFYHYNNKNLAAYASEDDYYLGGRLVRNGARDTEISYFMCLPFEELGNYTITNKYIVANGISASDNIGTFRILPMETTNIFYGSHKNNQTVAPGHDIRHNEVLFFGKYVDGNFILDSSEGLLSSDDNTTTPSAITLDYHGIVSKFIKDGNKIQFRKIDDNIYSDVTPNSSLSTELEGILTGHVGKTLDFSDKDYNIPLTNLQPVYFDYFGTFDYNRSKYYRFENCTYNVNDNGLLENISFTSIVSKSEINFTNKTSISAPGFYIVKVFYGYDATTCATSTSPQYFAFVINNAAPNLEIFTADESKNSTHFISSTEFSTTTRYTNQPYLQASWPTPNYFQGEVSLSYVRTTYDGNTILSSENDYANSSFITTQEGKYIFTIRYGIGSASYSTTYVIVDKTTPTGEMYSVSKNGNSYTTLTTNKINNIFGSYSVFASTPIEEISRGGSGAKVSARISIIGFNNYNNSGATDIYNKIIANANNTEIEAIRTDIELDANNTLFGSFSELDKAPKYNFLDINSINNEPLLENRAQVSPTQLLGNSDQSLVYIIKLYDEAGNSELYYYIFDKSLPYMVYQIMPSDGDGALDGIVETLENSTTQTNTNIYWGNYKAIHINNSNTTGELFNEFKSLIEQSKNVNNNFGRIFFKEINEDDGKHTYMYIPLNAVEITSTLSVNKVPIDAMAKTQSPTLKNRASIFVSKTQNEQDLADRINSYNPPANYILSNANTKETLDASYHVQFFKGDKNYTFKVIDIFGNSISQDITMNSSVAQETFFLNKNKEMANPTKQRAYNANQMALKYKDLISEKQAFSAKVTYDYFSINLEHYLSETESNVDQIYYYEYGYDVEKGEVYKYDHTDSIFKKCAYNTATRTYEYINSPTNSYLFEELPESVFFITYPFTIATNNSDITISDKEQDDGGSEYFISSDINTENALTKQGLYVFRRSYLDLAGNEITQEEIDSGNNEDLDILQDDYAVRYHVFYVDRNDIIDLTYKFNGSIDPIISLGDLSEIYLGKDISGKKEALITAETINNSFVNVNAQNLSTNKLKVETNLSIDKYSTIEKLQKFRKYEYDSSNDEGAGKSYNELIEDLSRSLNEIIFGYKVSLDIGQTKPVVNNNIDSDLAAYVQAVPTIMVSNSGDKTKTNYSSNFSDKYVLSITDNSAWEKYSIEAKNISFSFKVEHSSPVGKFTTKEDDEYSSVRDLPEREGEFINTTGRTITFVSSNVNNLSFTFSDTADKYYASINPYQVTVIKDINGLQTTILRVDKNTSGDGSYIDSFKGYMTNANAQFRDVFQIIGDQAPYSYIINIFDKNKPGELLSEWSEDAVYIVNINYIGNNFDDYTINGKNYYSTSCKIHIDRKPPELNLKNLVQNDPNVDLYTIQKYGLTYTQLSTGKTPDVQEKYKEFLSTYAFPVRLVEDSNLEYYYKKLHPTAIKTWDQLDEEIRNTFKDEIYTTYSTIFNYDNDDSINAFARVVGDDPTTYRYTILPNEAEYNAGINGHLKFTESSSEFNMFDYINDKINFSTADAPTSFTNNYYEIIEKDEAGNLTRYFVYLADNTNVEVNFSYMMQETDKITKYSTNGTDVNKDLNGKVLNQYITYENVNYYLSNHEGFWALYTKEYKSLSETLPSGETQTVWGIHLLNKNNSLSPEIETTIYHHNNSTLEIPSSVDISGVLYKIHNNENDSLDDLIGGNQIVNVDSPSDFMNMLNLSGIDFIKYDEIFNPVVPANYTKYVFDDYYTVNIYSVIGTTHNLIIKEVSDPFTTGSGHNHLQNVVNKFSDFAKNNSSVYRYKFEIVNRYGKTPFSIYANLPDADLELNFRTDATGNLLVTIPDASQYNVKIKEFSVFQYKDFAWRPLNQDSNGKLIQTSNTTNPDDGLPATTYQFGEGQYRFYFSDNFSRSKTTYQVVGQNVDNSVPTFSFDKAHIVEAENTYVTSGDTILLINDEYWEAKIILKNAVRVVNPENPSSYLYYDLMSSGNASTLCYKDGTGEYKYVYYHETDGINTASGKQVYYSMGSLFSNEACTSIIPNNLYEIRVSTNSKLVYTVGNNVGNKSAYIIGHFPQFSDITSNMSEYEIITNWTTDPTNKTSHSLTIDRSTPVITLMAESGLLTAINGQNYSKEFTISWRAGNTKYSIVSAKIIHSVNGKRNEIILDPNGSFDVHELGGYTLYLTDSIGNDLMINGQLGFTFNFTSKINEYFSVLIDNNGIGKINTLPSDYISTNKEDGKTIRYYYYKKLSTYTPVIEIETDTTKNIKYEAIDGSDDYFKIYRQIGADVAYVICYVRIIAVDETTDLTAFMAGLTLKGADGIDTKYYTSGSSNILPNTNWTLDQSYDSFTISVYKHLYDEIHNVDYIGNKVYVNQYYNDRLVKTYFSDSWATLDSVSNPPTIVSGTDTYNITISATGVHSFEFFDSVDNRALDRLNITLIKDIMYSVNDENPIDYRIYNGDVVVDIPTTPYYGDITVTATLNGKAVDDINGLKTGSKYTFTASGIYQVTMTARDAKDVPYVSVLNFTIINPNVTKMTFGFGNNYGFTISKVLKNNADITSQITAESMDSMWLTSGRPDTVGTYTITLLGYDKITNDYTPFTFVVKLNNETPSIFAVDYQFGTSTTKNVVIQYNPALIFSQVGESYIRVVNDEAKLDTRFDINSESLDELKEIILNVDGKYNITIYNKDDQFITNYTVTKVAPLNSAARFIIIIVSVVVIGLIVTFIVLRRHTKFR